MGIIAWIVLGLVAGIITKSLLGARHGIIVTILIGVAGALLGGWAAAKLFDVDTTQGFFDLTTWVTAIAGSAGLLLIYRSVASGNRRSGLRRRVRR